MSLLQIKWVEVTDRTRFEAIKDLAQNMGANDEAGQIVATAEKLYELDESSLWDGVVEAPKAYLRKQLNIPAEISITNDELTDVFAELGFPLIERAMMVKPVGEGKTLNDVTLIFTDSDLGQHESSHLRRATSLKWAKKSGITIAP